MQRVLKKSLQFTCLCDIQFKRSIKQQLVSSLYPGCNSDGYRILQQQQPCVLIFPDVADCLKLTFSFR